MCYGWERGLFERDERRGADEPRRLGGEHFQVFRRHECAQVQKAVQKPRGYRRAVSQDYCSSFLVQKKNPLKHSWEEMRWSRRERKSYYRGRFFAYKSVGYSPIVAIQHWFCSTKLILKAVDISLLMMLIT